tara:strand:+ start:609 stop:1442 length:834 start_codon:yes stop_codon:yes gene_type:complete
VVHNNKGKLLNKVTTKQDIAFNLPARAIDQINANAVAKVNKYLPELREKTRSFSSKNSQTTLCLMTLTMLTGQSPFRMIRQCMAEAEKRKEALAESQVNHAKLAVEIAELEFKTDPVSKAEFCHKSFQIDLMEQKINGSFTDIATLIDAYKNIMSANGIEEWDEESFEVEEKKHHVRRGFELMYRDLMQGGSPGMATLEYTAQYGVHPQVAATETAAYIRSAADLIAKGNVLHSNHLEDFFDVMANKYCAGVDKTSERIFGKTDFINKDYLFKTGKS